MRCGQRCGDNALGPTGLIDAGFDVTRRDRIDPNTLGRAGKRKECLGTLGCPALGPITSFLFLSLRGPPPNRSALLAFAESSVFGGDCLTANLSTRVRLGVHIHIPLPGRKLHRLFRCQYGLSRQWAINWTALL